MHEKISAHWSRLPLKWQQNLMRRTSILLVEKTRRGLMERSKREQDIKGIT